MAHADGTFEVRLAPQKPDNNEAESANLGRMSIDKQFYRDLDSGTGELAGLAGTLTTRIAEKQHFYEFDYTIA